MGLMNAATEKLLKKSPKGSILNISAGEDFTRSGAFFKKQKLVEELFHVPL
jgi:hypothetical protein